MTINNAVFLAFPTPALLVGLLSSYPARANKKPVQKGNLVQYITHTGQLLAQIPLPPQTSTTPNQNLLLILPEHPPFPTPLPRFIIIIIPINIQRIQIPLHTQQPQRVVRLLALGQHQHRGLARLRRLGLGLELLDAPVDAPRPVPHHVRKQGPQLGRAVVRRPAPELGSLVPPGLAPVGDLPRRLPPRQARDVAQPADQPVPLLEVLDLRPGVSDVMGRVVKTGGRGVLPGHRPQTKGNSSR